MMASGDLGMTIDPNDARTSLDDIESVERRTREAIVYDHTSAQFLLWGTLVASGYVFSFFVPTHISAGWIVVTAVGLAGSFTIRHWRGQSRDGSLGQRIGYAQFIVVGYGLVLMLLLWPMSSRQIGAFWPTLVMFCHTLAGLWLGTYFIYVGLTGTALIVAGYFWAGAWYPLWLAAVVGGGLIAAGLWLRRRD
jgi:hypothetical protein